MSERERIRQWRRAWHARIFFAVGLVLLAYSAQTMFPALWGSGMARGVALEVTCYVALTMVWAVVAMWRAMRPLWRERGA